MFLKWVALKENFSLLPQNPIDAEEFLRDVIEIITNNKNDFPFYHDQNAVNNYVKSIRSLITDEKSKMNILKKLEIQWQEKKHQADSITQFK